MTLIFFGLPFEAQQKMKSKNQTHKFFRYPTREHIVDVLVRPLYKNGMPEELNILFSPLARTQFAQIASKLHPMYYDFVINIALDENFYIMEQGKLSMRVIADVPIINAVNVLLCLASKLNVHQLIRCTNFFVAYDENLENDYSALFQCAKPELAVPILEEYICNVALPSNQKRSVAP